MKAEVTTKEAINIGKLMVIYPALFIFIAIPIALAVLSHQFNIHISIGLLIGLIIGVIVLKFYWNYFSKKWQIWAFLNVKNVHDLKRKANELRLINENFILNNNKQIKDFELKQKINHIQKRFDVEETFHDEFSVPKVTEIQANKEGKVLALTLGFFVLGSTIYLYINTKTISFNLVFLFIVGMVLLITGIFSVFYKEVQIRMDDSGVQLHQKEFIRWEDVNSCFVEKRFGGNNNEFYLVIKHKITVEHSITGMDLTPVRIEKLAQIYWYRNKKKILNR